MNSLQAFAKDIQSWKDKSTQKAEKDATVQRLVKEIKDSKKSQVIEPAKTKDGQELSVLDQLAAIEQKLNLDSVQYKKPKRQKTSLDLFQEMFKK